MRWNEEIFRKNDIRGIYNQDFDLDFVQNLASAFVCFYFRTQKKNTFKKELFGEKPIIAVGHDCRLSSPEIVQHLANTLALAGAEVRFLGMVPSPVCFFASHIFKKIHASIMVTASHNPASCNGFKIVLNKETICDEKILQLKKIIKTGSFLPPALKGKIISFDIESAYISFYTKKFLPAMQIASPQLFASHTASSLEPAFIKKKKLSIAIDCGNGTSGPLAQKVLKALKLPVKIHWLYAKPDGRFPNHHPDPSLEKNLKDLQKTIKEKNCDFGAAFDGDGDRLVIVGKSGKILHGDELMSVFISDILTKKLKKKTCPASSKSSEKSLVVADVKCADWFFDFLKRQGVKAIIWKSGHSLIRQKTIEKKALFGGELSGHFFFCDDYFTIDDGIYGLLRLISICFKTGKTPEELLIKKTSVETNEIRLATNISKAKKQIKYLKAHYINEKSAHCSFIDGVRVSFPAGSAWGLARLSNTQSEWTFRFGGKSKKDLKEIQTNFYQLLKIK